MYCITPTRTQYTTNIRIPQHISMLETIAGVGRVYRGGEWVPGTVGGGGVQAGQTWGGGQLRTLTICSVSLTQMQIWMRVIF
jgi:hypothetical protein